MRIPHFVCVWIGCGAIGGLTASLGYGVPVTIGAALLWAATMEIVAPRGEA